MPIFPEFNPQLCFQKETRLLEKEKKMGRAEGEQ
jgi:hypothetical protein